MSAARWMYRILPALAIVVGTCFGITVSAADPADVRWDDRFSWAVGANGGVEAAVVDGNGNLYIGGQFTSVGGVSASMVAKWDGTNWTALGSGITGDFGGVRALALDGSGNLYAGGSFNTAGGSSASNIAKWDGSSWSALGLGTSSGVSSLAMTGGNLYVGGVFTTAGGLGANYVAKWDGANWSALGSGLSAPFGADCRDLAVDGSGNLYAGGSFDMAGGVSARNVAKWNGASWSALGPGTNLAVSSLAVDGSGNLYAGGPFTMNGFSPASRVAMWDGFNWSALGSGLNDSPNALVIDGGNLYAGGLFTTAGGSSANGIAKWDGANWSALGTGVSNVSVQFPFVSALAVGSGNLYAGGYYSTAGDVVVNNIGRWNGTSWSRVGGLAGLGTDDAVRALAADGGGNVYAGGSFATAGGLIVRGIAKWNGTLWSALGSGVAGAGTTVSAVAVDGGGNLYAGGSFNAIDGVGAINIAKWNGTSWSALGPGINGQIYALVADGTNLYVGGSFLQGAGVVGADYIAKWDGANWSALGSGMSGDFTRVTALAVDGSGNLYAGGNFAVAGGTSVSNIAKWNGSSWSALGLGLVSGFSPAVSALAVDESGNLYAGGAFNMAGGSSASGIAKWNGASWSTLGLGVSGSSVPAVSALAVDGDGNLYAGGYLDMAGGASANSIASWNGTSWSTLGSGMTSGAGVSALAFASNGDLCVGGSFTTAGGKPSNYFAIWHPSVVSVDPSAGLEGSIRLAPNPTRDRVSIDYEVVRQARVRVTVLDLQGRKVATLAEGAQEPGHYRVAWSGEIGRTRAAAGVYLVRYEAAGVVQTRRVLLVR